MEMVVQRDGTLNFEEEAGPKDPLGTTQEPLNSAKDAGDPVNNPLTELKSVILSLEWEITDAVLGRFVDEIDRLKDAYSDDEVVVSFLGLLDSVGRYIKAHKGKAHPDAGKLLNSIYLSVERVILSKDMTDQEKRAKLSSELERFKTLKEKIALRKAAVERKQGLMGPDQAKAAAWAQKDEHGIQKAESSPDEAKERQLEAHEGHVIPDESLRLAVEGLKQLVQEEFKALREELRQLRESKERLI
jgi:hypothetical protein